MWKCYNIVVCITRWSDGDAMEAAQSSLLLRNFSQEGCMYGWQYDHSTYESTIVTEVFSFPKYYSNSISKFPVGPSMELKAVNLDLHNTQSLLYLGNLPYLGSWI